MTLLGLRTMNDNFLEKESSTAEWGYMLERNRYLNRSVRAGMKRKGSKERRQGVKEIMNPLVRGPCCVLVLLCVNNQVEFIMNILFIAKRKLRFSKFELLAQDQKIRNG